MYEADEKWKVGLISKNSLQNIRKEKDEIEDGKEGIPWVIMITIGRTGVN
jgi:hypothetical protein